MAVGGCRGHGPRRLRLPRPPEPADRGRRARGRGPPRAGRRDGGGDRCLRPAHRATSPGRRRTSASWCPSRATGSTAGSPPRTTLGARPRASWRARPERWWPPGCRSADRSGDHDPAQALEDELRDFPADEVVLLIANGKDPLAKIESRLGLPAAARQRLGRSLAPPPSESPPRASGASPESCTARRRSTSKRKASSMLTSIPPRPRPSWWIAVTTWRSPTGCCPSPRR